MNDLTNQPGTMEAADACWRRIGVAGDRSCPELRNLVHCRNCRVYSGAGRALLDREAPRAYVHEWTERLACDRPRTEAGTEAVLVFRLGEEWLGLPVAKCREVTDACKTHRLPHRKNPSVLGLANARGQLLLCISLKGLLGIEEPEPREEVAGRAGGSLGQRLIVVEGKGLQWLFPPDEIDGVRRFADRQLHKVPVTLAKASSSYTKGLCRCQDRDVGLLDEELLTAGILRIVQ